MRRKIASEMKLNPCPLCGGVATAHETPRGGGYVKCNNYNCGCSTTWLDDVGKAVALWNKRPKNARKERVVAK